MDNIGYYLQASIKDNIDETYQYDQGDDSDDSDDGNDDLSIDYNDPDWQDSWQ